MKNKASLTVIFFTVFIDLMGFGILIPILPTFASKDLGVSDFEIGFLIAVFSLVQFLFNPLLGKMSDKFGRRPLILITLLLTAASYIIFSFAASFLVLFLSRLLAGFGGSNIGVAQAYIADVTHKKDRAKGMGLIGAAFGLGFVFGPVIGGFLSKLGYEYAGYGSAAFSFLAFIFAFIFLPESNTKKKSESKLGFKLFDWKFTKETIKNPSVSLMMLLFFIIVFSMANIYGTFAILGYKHYGFTDIQNSYLFGIIGIVGAIMQGGAIRSLSKIFTDRTLVLTGSIFMMLGLGLLPYGGNFTGVGIVGGVLAIGTGILQPTLLSMISKFAPSTQQGAVLGLNQSFASFARVLGPLWGGFSYEFLGYEFPFLTGAAFTLLTFIITLIFLNSSKVKESY
ncbi:MAG: MFS transporter [Ignavibacteriae bacterium]|nr:MFS transporter [Ignavibacteriota bacterium]NOG98679.1 MFS transporter [Ignavibacteriota bacterium]